jgi:hypothetical protein
MTLGRAGYVNGSVSIRFALDMYDARCNADRSKLLPGVDERR